MGKNLIAILVLVILGVASFFVFRDKPTEEKEALAATVKSVPQSRLSTIRIVRREGSGDKATKENIVLKKKKDTWQMTEPVDYPVVTASVDRMVEALGSLKAVDVISENASKHSSFEVDDASGIEVTALEGKEELSHFIIGKSRRNMTFVRVPGSDAVYRIQGSHRSAFNKSSETLRNKTILDLESSNVKKVTFATKDNELVLERQGEEDGAKLAPVGTEIENFNESKASGIVSSLLKLRARSFVDEPRSADKTGLTDDADRVVIELKGSGEPELVTLWLGNDDEKSHKTHLKSSQSEQLFLVSTSTTKRFRVKADDFARTDKELAEEEERKKKAAEAAAKRGNMPPGMGGMPGNQQIPPDMMRKIQAQLAKQPPPQ